MKRTGVLIVLHFLLTEISYAQAPLLVRDITGSAGSSNPDNFVVADGKLLFAANSFTGGTDNRELFVSDGSSAGTLMLADLIPGAASSSPAKMIAYDDKAYFIITDSTTGTVLYRPWVSDGTVLGTFPLLPVPVTSNGYTMVFNSNDSPDNIFVFCNDFVYFRARKDNSVNDHVIFKTDGTLAGTQVAVDLPNTTSTPNILNGPVVFRDSLYFSGTSNGSSAESLYRNAGTPVSTVLIKSNLSLHAMYGHAVYDQHLFFCGSSSSNGHGPELWVTDGSSSGTLELTDLRTDAGIGSSPGSFTLLNGKLFFIANTSGTGVELYMIDSTAAGLPPAQVSAISFTPFVYQDNYLLPFNGKLYFTGQDFLNGTEVWVTDGTLGGTGILADLNPGTGNADPQGYIVYCNRIYFSAFNPNGQLQQALYVTDGTVAGTQLIPGTSATPGGGEYTGSKIVYNGKLLFSGLYDPGVGNELYAYDAGCFTVIPAIPEPAIRVYPNPADNTLHLLADPAQSVNVAIFDGFGRQVSFQLLPAGKEVIIDVSGWPNGWYLIDAPELSGGRMNRLIIAR